jgi:mannose-6-phosphate isomerase
MTDYGGNMYPFKLKPAVKSYLWGGNRLSSEFGIGTDETPIAEAWMLSCHPAGTSVILNGSLAGKPLSEVLPGNFEKILGAHSPADAGFPILIKFIDANKDLSIQVHPGNEYHGVDSGESGKTEMWYILDAQEGAYIYYGFSKEVTKEEMLKHIEEKTITSILNRVYVKKGDSFYIKSGTVHSMGPGVFVAEIQQSSDLTYRIYDYDRTDAAGNTRELHIDKALDVADRTFVAGPSAKMAPSVHDGYRISRLVSCEYFTVDFAEIKTSAEFSCGDESFESILITEGSGQITFDNSAFPAMNVKKGDSILLPVGTGRYRIEGVCEAILTRK